MIIHFIFLKSGRAVEGPLQYFCPAPFHGQRYSILKKKSMRNSVPKCPCKLLQPADQPMAGSSSLEGHFGTGLRACFSSAWSNVECAPSKSLGQVVKDPFLPRPCPQELDCGKIPLKIKDFSLPCPRFFLVPQSQNPISLPA